MTYYRNSNRDRYRTIHAGQTGRVDKPNKRPGPCRDCHEVIPAGTGLLYREESGAWSVVHRPREWAGSPTSGQYTYGCPAETDRLNIGGRFGPESGPLSEYDRIEQAAAMYAASAGREQPRGSYRRRSYATLSSGARVQFGPRCEDAPCCGCCD